MADEIIDEKRREFLGMSALVLSGVVVGGATVGSTAMAQATGSTANGRLTPAKEPAVIGYPNRRGVTIERVTYKARNTGTLIVANLFKPAGFDASKKYPAIVVTHPFGGVKEQTAGLYAQHLAEEGFVTLAYDASFQGESGGEPRLMEVPAQRLDDISCGIDFLVQQPFVDAGRIGSLGICAGGGYAMCNAQTELRVRAVATVSMATCWRRSSERDRACRIRTPCSPPGAARQPRRGSASVCGKNSSSRAHLWSTSRASFESSGSSRPAIQRAPRAPRSCSRRALGRRGTPTRWARRSW